MARRYSILGLGVLGVAVWLWSAGIASAQGRAPAGRMGTFPGTGYNPGGYGYGGTGYYGGYYGPGWGGYGWNNGSYGFNRGWAPGYGWNYYNFQPNDYYSGASFGQFGNNYSSFYYPTESNFGTLNGLGMNSNRALVNVRVPADATVWFDDAKTRQTGEFRQFMSPPLEAGNYQYQVRAHWTQDGKAVDQTRTVTVQPGRQATVDFFGAAPNSPARIDETAPNLRRPGAATDTEEKGLQRDRTIRENNNATRDRTDTNSNARPAATPATPPASGKDRTNRQNEGGVNDTNPPKKNPG